MKLASPALTFFNIQIENYLKNNVFYGIQSAFRV